MPTRVSEELIERVLKVLQRGSTGTHRDIAAAMGRSGVSEESVLVATTVLHERHQIYAKNWYQARNGKWTPIYAFGNRPDTPTPGVKRVRNRDYQSRERDWLRESRSSGSQVFRHPWDVWLFGECAPTAVCTNWERRVVRRGWSEGEMEAA